MSIPSPFTKGAPDAPDYKGAANTQTQANRPNQTTPFASSSWTQDPKTGAWSQSVGLNGPLAGLSSTLGNEAASAWGTPLSNGADARKAAVDSIYGQATSRLDPQWGQREHDMTAALANQGIDPNSAAYGKQLDNFGRSRNDAYTSAMMNAIMGGGQAAQQQQQLDLNSRMAPLGALGSLRDLSGMPGFSGAGDYLGAARSAGQYGLDAQNMNQGFWSDLIGGGVGLGKSLKIPGFASLPGGG